MKKSFFSFFSALVVAVALSSCGEKLLTDAEVTSMIDTEFNAKAPTIISEMDAECQANLATRVEAETARLVAEAEAAEAAATTPQ